MEDKEKLIKILLNAFLILCVTMFMFVIANKTFAKKEVKVTYKENVVTNYNVQLKENDFNIAETNKFIADLVDQIETVFEYRADFNVDDVDFKYTYNIMSDIQVFEDDSSQVLYTSKDILKGDKTLSTNSSRHESVKETLNIDYQKYNMLAKKFISSYGLENVTSVLNIIMNVKVTGVDNAEAKETSIIYSIPLNEKTIKVDSKSTLNDDNTISKTENTNRIMNICLFFVVVAIDLYLVISLVMYVINNKTKENQYKSKVNKILGSYDSYIQKVNESTTNIIEIDNTTRIYNLESFTDMLEIRDNLNAPILMFENEEKTCTEFRILDLVNKVVYVYKINL